MVARSTLFDDKLGQVLRLPESVAFPEGVQEVEIIKVGHTLMISPVGHRWDAFFLYGPRASEDFMKERIDPLPEEREPL